MVLFFVLARAVFLTLFSSVPFATGTVVMMTGAMVVIAPGSSAQPLVALLLQLFFLLLILKAAPYSDDADDWSSFITSLTLALTMLCGFAIMADEGRADRDLGDSSLAGSLLVVISTACLVYEVFGLMASTQQSSLCQRLPCCRSGGGAAGDERSSNTAAQASRRKGRNGGDGGGGGTGATKVAPIGDGDLAAINQRAQRSWAH